MKIHQKRKKDFDIKIYQTTEVEIWNCFCPELPDTSDPKPILSHHQAKLKPFAQNRANPYKMYLWNYDWLGVPDIFYVRDNRSTPAQLLTHTYHDLPIYSSMCKLYISLMFFTMDHIVNLLILKYILWHIKHFPPPDLHSILGLVQVLTAYDIW